MLHGRDEPDEPGRSLKTYSAMFHPQGPTFWELMTQALSSTERGYDLIAPKFDYTPFRTPDGVLQIVMDHVAQQGQVAAGLDVCCGTGAALRWLRPVCQERAVGVDVSAGMLHVARERLADAPGSAKLELVRGDALRMPFADGEFDLAVCFGAFGHIDARDQPQFVSEVGRVLRPGGRFVFICWHRPPLWSLQYWWRRVFNGVMRVRNWLLAPPFIMYYLTFLLPGARAVLETHGFTVAEAGVQFPEPWSDFQLVVATRK